MILEAVLGVGIGLVLGGLFFGGLWLTVRGLSDARRPGALMALSTVGRLALMLAAFAALAALGTPATVAGALLGFLVLRFAVVGRMRAAGTEAPPGTPGPGMPGPRG